MTCTSTSHCIAVGDSFSPDVGNKVLIQQWDGHRWTLMAGRNQPGSLNILYDVACLGPTNCFAVGFFYARHGTNKALIEHWDGEHWALMPTPKVFGSTGTSLSGVACPLVNSCFAVGSFAAKGHGIALIEHWDGTRWTVFPSRTPYDTFAALTDVSCGSADRCVAVGTIDFNGHMQPLVERFNGQIWQMMSSAKPARRVGFDRCVLLGRNQLFRGRLSVGPPDHHDTDRAMERRPVADRARHPNRRAGSSTR